MAGDAASHLSKGGMRTKLMAARTATGAGCALAITLGAVDKPLTSLENGALATWFLPGTDPQTARKAWIAAMKPRGSVTIDEGAARALGCGKSLLPAGIVAISGTFQRGDPIAIQTADGGAIGSGLSRYSAAETRQIAGCQSGDIAARLGYPGRAALIHRDDMVL